MEGLSINFVNPWLLTALAILPLIWFLLRITPPKPQREIFPPFYILKKLTDHAKVSVHSPWWLTLLRLSLCAAIIIALAEPIWNPEKSKLAGNGPVLLIVDDGWASGTSWEQIKETASSLLNEAENNGRSVAIAYTVDKEKYSNEAINITSASQALKKLSAHENFSLQVNHSKTAKKLDKAFERFQPSSIVWLSDGLKYKGTQDLIETISRTNSGQAIIYVANPDQIIVIDKVVNNPDALVVGVVRAGDSTADNIKVVALDKNGQSITTSSIKFGIGQTTGKLKFDGPIELRNQIERIILPKANNAGAVRLLDNRNYLRTIGLITDQSINLAQPLLSPNYYITRALQPFSDVRSTANSNLLKAIPELIQQNLSAIILADIGTIPDEIAKETSDWVKSGGMLIRFAGSRLSGTVNDTLLPVVLRQKDRLLGEALTWEQPKLIAPFDVSSPFYGLPSPTDVVINRQVIALQESDLAEKTWASLEDGTPLVTGKRHGKGWIVFFHVSADTSWSNLPISGTFVEMLRRITEQSRITAATEKNMVNKNKHLLPLQLINGMGNLVPPDAQANPLIKYPGKPAIANIKNPPGFYGSSQTKIALNLFQEPVRISKITNNDLPSTLTKYVYKHNESLTMKPYFLTAAIFLLVLDCLIVFSFAGVLARLTRTFTIFAVFATSLFLSINEYSYAQDFSGKKQSQGINFSSALGTHIAWVKTGVYKIDKITKAGLIGLNHYIAMRTTLELGPPVAVNIATDELAFYSIIYWPIHPESEIPSPEAMGRIDAFMKQGGTVLFDTRDQKRALLAGNNNTAEAIYLQNLLASLDIPPLEPVSSNHVLGRTFYLLQDFPGRYSGGKMWVESSQSNSKTLGDGISSIIITSNDLSGAWAIDKNFMPLLPTLPPNPIQRELAFRTGVNLMMYVLTGNYKADQVHLPALLERLGQ